MSPYALIKVENKENLQTHSKLWMWYEQLILTAYKTIDWSTSKLSIQLDSQLCFWPPTSLTSTNPSVTLPTTNTNVTPLVTSSTIKMHQKCKNAKSAKKNWPILIPYDSIYIYCWKLRWIAFLYLIVLFFFLSAVCSRLVHVHLWFFKLAILR